MAEAAAGGQEGSICNCLRQQVLLVKLTKSVVEAYLVRPAKVIYGFKQIADIIKNLNPEKGKRQKLVLCEKKQKHICVADSIG